MKEKYFSIAIRLKDKKALIVGGGEVAERKAKTMLDFGARVRVVSPTLTTALKGLVRSGKIKWLNRPVRSPDVKGVDIIIAATSSTGINRKISHWAKRQGILVNVVDNAELSSFISPAVATIDKAVISVQTNGRQPELSRDIKNFLKENWDVFLSYRRRLQNR